MSAERRLQHLCQQLLNGQKVEPSIHQFFLSRSRQKFSNLNSGSPPVVIGGMVLDIHANPSSTARAGTTTPGKISSFQISFVKGGVARNVAECMAKLGSKPFIISIVGTDVAGDTLLEHWKSLGLSTEGILRCEGIATPVVSNIFDLKGEIAAAVASVDALELFLTPEWISRFEKNISSAPVVMVDANLNPLSLKAACQLAEASHTPVWFEPVSVIKSKRIETIIDYVQFISPNEDELLAMADAVSSGYATYSFQTGKSATYRHSAETLLQNLKPAIRVLQEKGIDVILLTLGSNGAFLCLKDLPHYDIGHVRHERGTGTDSALYSIMSSGCQCLYEVEQKINWTSPKVLHFPALPVSVVRLTGAGDCLVGGVLASLCAGLDILKSTAVGIAAAKAAVMTDLNVPQEFFLTSVAGRSL
ncbi:Pseudouridine kinase [Nymphaea thermarum]|nr:Pseudouridine kinase [Nymphaea thermarum]